MLSIPCLINYLAFNDPGFEDSGNESRTIDINWNCKSHSYDYDYGRRQANCPGSIFQNSTDFCLDWKSDAWKDEVCNSKNILNKTEKPFSPMGCAMNAYFTVKLTISERKNIWNV